MKNNHKSWSKKAMEWGCLLVVCLGVCGISFGQYGGGSGTSTAPYLIYTAEQFNAIGANIKDWGKCFKLMTDIDLSAYIGTQYNRIGTSSKWSFTGVLDGNGHTISNLTYDANSTKYVGLVGYLGHGGVIKNLGLVGVHVTGYSHVGSMVGNSSSGIVANCYASGSISGTNDIGGLVGYSSGIVINCYATGFVSGTILVGGLIGESSGTVINCHASGAVSGSELVGGLTGAGVEAVNSFWDIQTSGQTASAGGKGRTTQQMWQAETYMGWNSDGQVDWVIDEDKDYPRLAWEGRSGQPIPSYSLSDFLAGSGTADDPYLISTAEQFNSICRFPSQWDRQYRLAADIDLVGTEVMVLGVSQYKPFTGVLDGNGHTISNLTYDANSTNNVGLVGYLGFDGVIQNLGLINVHVTGGQSVGGLVGYNAGTVRNCYSSGSISGAKFVGGLMGDNIGIVINCYTSGSVSGDWAVGGFVGDNFSRGGNPVIHCYSTVFVSGNGSTVGGLVGIGSSMSVENSFWDIEISGQSESMGGVGKTTAEMQDFDTYLNADWDLHWTICDGKDYPRLRWENTECEGSN